MDLSPPAPLFNPATAERALTPWELAGSPLGLLVFLPYIPFVLWAARRAPCAALYASGVIWVAGTAGPMSAAVLIVWMALALGWVELLAALRSRGVLTRSPQIALLWIGLHALVLPLWWQPNWPWYGMLAPWQPSRLAPLHQMGFAYLMLRLLAWGVQRAREHDAARELARLVETLAWLWYVPCMRLGPVMPRETFVQRLRAWRAAPLSDRAALHRRGGLALLGLAGLGATAALLPHVGPNAADFFESPREYPTAALVAVVYLIPLQIYLFLWTYNEIAAFVSYLVGIPVDDNFDCVPRSRSTREFWRRWHITLGAWLRDLIYIPLGGNRGFVPLNYAAVFVYCGVWHGASWSFVAWGLLQALMLTIEHYLMKPLAGVERSRLWTRVCDVAGWLWTMQYQTLAILILADFQYLGSRILPELWSRLVG